MNSDRDVKDNSEEEIPALTVKTDEEYEEIRENLKWWPTNYKIVELFIADLLTAEKVEDCNYFRFKKINFKSVKIKGTVVGIGQMGERIVITVDDGSAQIDCFLSLNKKLQLLNENVNTTLSLMAKSQQDDNDAVDKGALILLSRCKKKLSKLPLDYDQVNLGDNVVLVGNLSEYFENRNIFIKHIFVMQNCDAGTEAMSLNRDIDLYEHHLLVD